MLQQSSERRNEVAPFSTRLLSQPSDATVCKESWASAGTEKGGGVAMPWKMEMLKKCFCVAKIADLLQMGIMGYSDADAVFRIACYE